jgi:hypothetical protein
MKISPVYILKATRKIYSKFFGIPASKDQDCEHNPDIASEIIYNALADGKPAMIARYGSTEMLCMVNYLGVLNGPRILKYIQGKQAEWWWEDNVMDQMTRWSGFFPSTPDNCTRFSQLMIESTKDLDVLGSWLVQEQYFIKKNTISKVWLIYLEPFWALQPWTRILRGKKVLVVHPFAGVIESQYKYKRALLFKNDDILPEFVLHTIAAVQSLGGDNARFGNWFEALDWMQSEIDLVDYDICLLGCGAYGFPLAAHIKQQGKQAVHMGGALQLLFGIKGKRWTDPQKSIDTFGKPGMYESLFNEHWVFPGEENKPKNADQVEGACYW